MGMEDLEPGLMEVLNQAADELQINAGHMMKNPADFPESMIAQPLATEPDKTCDMGY